MYRPRLRQQLITLTHAEIKSIGNGTPIDIVAAPGADRLIRLVSAAAMLDTLAGAYGNTASGSGWAFFQGGSNYASSVVPVDVLLTEAARVPLLWSPAFSGDADMVGEDDFAGLIISKRPTTSPINQPLQLSDWWANGSYNAGHPANTLLVSVAYVILNTLTGRYV